MSACPLLSCALLTVLPGLAPAAVAGLAPATVAGLAPAAVAGLAPATVAGPPPLTQLERADERLLARDVTEIERWMERYESRGEPWLLGTESDLRKLLGSLSAAALDPAARERALIPILDLAAITTSGDRGFTPPGELAESTKRLRRLALRTLREVYAEDPEALDWLGRTVLASSAQPLARRVAAARSAAGQPGGAALLALFTAARADERELRQAATEALVGRSNERAHEFLTDQLLRWAQDPSWIDPQPVWVHFETAFVPPGSATATAVTAALGEMLAAADWRTAARSLRVARTLPDELAIPALIDALDVWDAREPGSRRLVADLASELARRSGRKIGPHPARWRTWWQAVQEGRIVPGSPDDATARTRAGFFGLRPETDRVVFVVDRSGSMSMEMGTEERYDRAVDELLGFLRALGPETRFRIVLFSDDLSVDKRELRTATEKNLEHARRWLLQQRPRGGTHLEPAVREAMRVGPTGRPDLAALEADTVIVLCDGETAEGPGWVESLMASANAEACLVFHGVQIGGAGDGTLQRLAKLTGGEFVQVGGH